MAFWADLRFGARILLKRPTFAATALLTLAVGIGMTTAIFSLVNSVLLRPLPYADPARLYQVSVLNLRTGRTSPGTSPLNFLDLRSGNRTFSSLGGYVPRTPFSLTANGEPERIVGALVSDSFLPTLGVSPIVGRTFDAGDDRRDAAPTVAMISDRLARRYFGSPDAALGRVVSLDLRPHTIVGVLPATFAFPTSDTDAWVPLGFVYEDGGRGNFFVDVVGRLAAGVSPERGESDLRAVAAGLAKQYPGSDSDLSVAVTSLRDALTGSVKSIVLLLFGAAGLVLLIACANVANLLLARASGRRREMAVRRALGASRSRLVRQLLSESMLLATGGGLAGLLVAAWCLRAFAPFQPVDLPTVGAISIDGRAFLFAMAVALTTGALFGLAPAWTTSSTAMVSAIGSGGRTAGPAKSMTRWLLVAGEVALSLVLLIGAGLLIRSLWRVVAVDTGFDTQGLLTFDVALPFTKYDRPATASFFSHAIDRLTALPGVESAGATTVLPLRGENNTRYFSIEGRPGDAPRDYTIANHRLVSDRYFSTVGMRLIRGRAFGPADLAPGAAPVAVVNQAFAQAFLGDTDPIGKRLKMGETTQTAAPWMTVVGVVDNVRSSSLELTGRAELYRPFTQVNSGENERKMTFVLRTAQAPDSLAAAARLVIRDIDSDQPIANVATMEQLLGRSLGKRRFSLVLIEVFAITALGLTAIGLYGLMAYAAEQGKRAIGVRLALGAQPRDILALVIGPGLAWAGAGVAIGLAATLALSRLIGGMLFGVAPMDPTSLVSASALVLFIALVACYVPARRASHLDPIIALRNE